MKVKTLTSILGHPARAIAVASVLFVGGLPATPAAASDIGPSRFAVRNCTAVKMLVCAYDKQDNILLIPYHAKYVRPGNKERFSCNTADKCKVFMGMSDAKIKEVLDTLLGNNLVFITAGLGAIIVYEVASGAVAAMYLGAATTAMTTTATAVGVAAGVVGAAAAVGTVVAVTKFIDGINLGEMCKKMMKDQKDIISGIENDAIRQLAKDSRKVKVNTRFPKYKNYTMKTEQGVMVFEQGNDC